MTSATNPFSGRCEWCGKPGLYVMHADLKASGRPVWFCENCRPLGVAAGETMSAPEMEGARPIDPFTGKIMFNADNKFDLQLSQALIAEKRLALIFTSSKIERIELKSESWLWERKGNICIEFRRGGKRSGIAVTEADMWVHELLRDGKTLLYLMFPIGQLKQLCREAIREGRVSRKAGDGGLSEVVLLSISDLLAWLMPSNGSAP